MSNEDVLRCFWLPNGYYRTTSSGVNENTIRDYSTNTPCVVGLDSMNKRKADQIIMKSKSLCVDKNRGYLRNNKKYSNGFVDIVNDALEAIYSGFRGFVFNEDQAITVCSFLNHPLVEIGSECIYISVVNKK